MTHSATGNKRREWSIPPKMHFPGVLSSVYAGRHSGWFNVCVCLSVICPWMRFYLHKRRLGTRNTAGNNKAWNNRQLKPTAYCHCHHPLSLWARNIWYGYNLIYFIRVQREEKCSSTIKPCLICCSADPPRQPPLHVFSLHLLHLFSAGTIFFHSDAAKTWPRGKASQTCHKRPTAPALTPDFRFCEGRLQERPFISVMLGQKCVINAVIAQLGPCFSSPDVYL